MRARGGAREARPIPFYCNPGGIALEIALTTWPESFTQPGDLMCDPFSGGGTVAVAAKMTGRKCVAAEKDAADHAGSIERLKNAPGFVPPEISATTPGTLSAVFGPRAAEPPARLAGTEEARLEGVRDALEGVSAEVIVLRPRDIADAGRKLRRRRFTR